MNQRKTTSNQRRSERKPASDSVLVTDVINDQPMGRLGNLSNGGMLLMLIGPRAPRSEALYQVRMALPASSPARSTPPGIEVGIQEQWHESAASGQVWAGYRIVAISEDDVGQLERWLASP